MEGRFNGGFLRYELRRLIFGGDYTRRGLFSEFYGMLVEIKRSKGTKCVCFFYGKLEWKNCCYLVFGDKKKKKKKKCIFFKKDKW